MYELVDIARETFWWQWPLVNEHCSSLILLQATGRDSIKIIAGENDEFEIVPYVC
jgi:hypothetical protein